MLPKRRWRDSSRIGGGLKVHSRACEVVTDVVPMGNLAHFSLRIFAFVQINQLLSNRGGIGCSLGAAAERQAAYAAGEERHA